MEAFAILEISCQFCDTDIENMKIVTPWEPVNNSMRGGEKIPVCRDWACNASSSLVPRSPTAEV